MDLGSSRGSGLQKLEMLPSIDAFTVAVLALDLYVLYSGLSGFEQEQVLSVSGEPTVVAIQLTAVALVFYGIELLADWKAKH